MGAHLITGGAGFVGANLARELISRHGVDVVILDNMSRGNVDNVACASPGSHAEIHTVDCSELDEYRACLAQVVEKHSVSCVWHLAANSDIPAGINDPRIDLRDTFLTTFNTLLLMKEFGLAKLNFASSSAIYGNLGMEELHEDIGPICPISNYGAMKYASEVQIRAAVEASLGTANIFRFPNVVGVPATHGVILDFARKLKASSSYLDVLGNGTQQKSYLHVADLVDAMLHIDAVQSDAFGVFNIGPLDDGVEVRWIAETVRAMINPRAELRFGTEDRGWVGDVPRFRYSIAKLAATGWRPSMSSAEAVHRAAKEIVAQEFAL